MVFLMVQYSLKLERSVMLKKMLTAGVLASAVLWRIRHLL